MWLIVGPTCSKPLRASLRSDVAILCYTITGRSKPNRHSTTGAEDGHVGAVLKGDHEEARAQLYSELAANRLAMTLGIPVIVGVPARRSGSDSALRFAALRVAETGLNLYDFTADDLSDEGDLSSLPVGVYRGAGHLHEMAAMCKKYPMKAAEIAVFDLWIGNEDRALNFKATLQSDDRGVIFALDQGSSLLSCRATIDESIESLGSSSHPKFHPFRKLVHGRPCGAMVERIQSMPNWAIEAATIYQDTVGNVTLPDQYQAYEKLLERRKMLGEMVDRLLL